MGDRLQLWKALIDKMEGNWFLKLWHKTEYFTALFNYIELRDLYGGININLQTEDAHSGKWTAKGKYDFPVIFDTEKEGRNLNIIYFTAQLSKNSADI